MRHFARNVAVQVVIPPGQATASYQSLFNHGNQHSTRLARVVATTPTLLCPYPEIGPESNSTRVQPGPSAPSILRTVWTFVPSQTTLEILKHGAFSHGRTCSG